VLQVKAAKPLIAETNLTVVTADGSLYSYMVSYQEGPARLTLQVQNTETVSKPVAVFTAEATTDKIAATSALVNSKQRILKELWIKGLT
jgi:delta-aminolevulinic acid dehydratase/porphobilinogen synthase